MHTFLLLQFVKILNYTVFFWGTLLKKEKRACKQSANMVQAPAMQGDQMATPADDGGLHAEQTCKEGLTGIQGGFPTTQNIFN